jgi:type II secretory ATPase GspE/PulE/Tfp pilus assembly ATPase PilB-like protein
LLIPNLDIQGLIAEHASLRRIRELAVKNGMKSLRLDGLYKVNAGITTIDEILRATTDED